MKKCIIIGAGEFNGFCADFTADFIIAADGGYDALTRYGFKADLLVGDFDSINCNKNIPDNIEVITFPKAKDSSDLELAVDEAIKRGFDCFYIYGALGKRLDHTLASIAVLVALSQKKLTGYLIGENETITAVTDSKLTLSACESGVISVFAAREKAEGVNLKGLKYPLDNAVLTHYSTHGLSNEFLGEEAIIEVQNGTLIVVTVQGCL